MPPAIALSTGDPAGVGPELSLRLLSEVSDRCQPILLGDARVLQEIAKRLRLAAPPVVPLAAAKTEADWRNLGPGAVIVDIPNIELDAFTPGSVNAATGRAAYEYVVAGIDASVCRQVSAIVTGPIHKDALHAAGISYPGHTEILAERTGAERICMMLTSESITCSVVTAHVGLWEVPDLLTEQLVFDAIELSYQAMCRIRNRPARIVVCGLNPHAGEGGLFGRREEERILQPAIDRAVAAGMQVRGPLPADTAFIPAIRAETDAYVCMYHDQGLIPLKALSFDTGVNVTLGLPIVRTSVDHGTALDLAWTGKASISSFVSAVDLAIQLAST